MPFNLFVRSYENTHFLLPPRPPEWSAGGLNWIESLGVGGFGVGLALKLIAPRRLPRALGYCSGVGMLAGLAIDAYAPWKATRMVRELDFIKHSGLSIPRPKIWERARVWDTRDAVFLASSTLGFLAALRLRPAGSTIPKALFSHGPAGFVLGGFIGGQNLRVYFEDVETYFSRVSELNTFMKHYDHALVSFAQLTKAEPPRAIFYSLGNDLFKPRHYDGADDLMRQSEEFLELIKREIPEEVAVSKQGAFPHRVEPHVSGKRYWARRSDYCWPNRYSKENMPVLESYIEEVQQIENSLKNSLTAALSLKMQMEQVISLQRFKLPGKIADFQHPADLYASYTVETLDICCDMLADKLYSQSYVLHSLRTLKDTLENPLRDFGVDVNDPYPEELVAMLREIIMEEPKSVPVSDFYRRKCAHDLLGEIDELWVTKQDGDRFHVRA